MGNCRWYHHPVGWYRVRTEQEEGQDPVGPVQSPFLSGQEQWGRPPAD
jgi:hypothetical protein